ncbi:programmed cell death 1 ligand 2-like [Tiliqua scincoides]|uniref:programmed cell death 1 ligand 2-like n=1 Tax=Tiliqua scincoides TaxID=71010 RepID=UPI0034620E75
MLLFLRIVLLDIQFHVMTALFTVEVLQPHYDAEYGSDVKMGCRFPVDSQLNLIHLSILWSRMQSETQKSKEVYKLHRGQEDLTLQDEDYRGRATLLQEELQMGRSVLHLTKVKPTDAGIYICVIDYGGSDYKYITLEVVARYKRINLQEIGEDEDLILTCQSEGYPLAEVVWYSEKNPNVSMPANTTYELTKDGLFNITSILKLQPRIAGNYSCVFWNKKLNQNTSTQTSVFALDPVHTSTAEKPSPILFILPICLLASFLLPVFICKVRRSKSFKNLCIQRGRRQK